MGQRYQISLLPEFEQPWALLNPAAKSRGPYKKKTAEEKETKALRWLSTSDPGLVGSGFIKLESGNYIYDIWNENYQFITYRNATAKMKNYLSDNALLDQQSRRNLIDYTV